MADKNLRARVTGLATQAVSNPLSRAAYGAAKGVTGAAVGVTGAAVGALRGRSGSEDQPGSAEADASLMTAQPVGAPAEDTLDSAGAPDEETTAGESTAGETTAGEKTAGETTAGETTSDAADATGSPDLDLLPYPQLEEPIPVVEETLAAEAEHGPPVGGHATEPHASTRDEAHGDAQLQRAEQAEIAEEVAEALPGGDLDLETPVGTTGADVGYNPDTAEADLQQPGTAPGIEPGLTSSIRKDEQRGLAAAGGADESS